MCHGTRTPAGEALDHLVLMQQVLPPPPHPNATPGNRTMTMTMPCDAWVYAGEALDYLVQQALDPNAAGPEATGPDGQPRQPTFLETLRATANSVSYFMKSLRS